MANLSNELNSCPPMMGLSLLAAAPDVSRSRRLIYILFSWIVALTVDLKVPHSVVHLVKCAHAFIMNHGFLHWCELETKLACFFFFYLHQFCVCAQNNSKPYKRILMTFSGNAAIGPRKSSLNFDNVPNSNFDLQRIKARGAGFNPDTYCRQIANI